MGKLEGKVAAITGGASGIGAGTARLFVHEGASVVISDIQDAKGEQLARDLGPSAVYQHADVTREPDVKALVELAQDKFGRLDFMFNNAGFVRGCPSILEVSLEDYEVHMAVLMRGVFLGVKHAGTIMKQQRSGSIVNTASVAGLRTGGNHVYNAAKAAVIHFTRSVAMEFADYGVRVNSICPGGIVTPIFGIAAGLSADKADRTLEAAGNALKNFQPIPRAGTPEDIARAALWLASDDSSFVTGHALVVDGGFTLGKTWSANVEMWTQFFASLRAAV